MSGENQQRDSLKDSFIYPERQRSGILKFLQKFDFFSFIPVPKDEPVSTKRSIIGSCIFIVLFLIYVAVDLYQFISDNPPIVQNAQAMLDEQFYTLPKTAITFMQGQSLNITKNYQKYLSIGMTKQLKDNSIKLSTPIAMDTNNNQYLKYWLGEKTMRFYTQLMAPTEDMKAKGLVYSTQDANYTKITIGICDLNKQGNQCENFQNISSLMAKGRIFLFIEEMEDQSGVASQSVKPSKFRIANFFLIPRLYKRVTIQFQVIKTTVLPDYFHHFSTRNFVRLSLHSIAEQTSDTSINDRQRSQESIQMLGITYQLAAQTLQVRVTYTTLLDHVAKWGAFFNVLFAVFAIFFLAYNKNKFYQKNPQWDRFKNRKKSDHINYSDNWNTVQRQQNGGSK